MNRTTFKAACSALWGPQYRSEAARQLKVHLRTVMRWDSGESRVSQSADHKLVVLLKARQLEIAKLVCRLAAE
jgi:hypothetical protein